VEAIASSLSYTEALRRLGMRPVGGNWKTLRRYATEVWHIPVEHFDPRAGQLAALRRRPVTPLAEVLVVGSSYSRGTLKRRLFREGLKQRACELCGQGELWRGRCMALILDHVNGVATDNRLENLRIVCPNCAATLDTHCGRNVKPLRPCAVCGALFHSYEPSQAHCSRGCGGKSDRNRKAQRAARRVERPPYERLVAEIAASGYRAVGRRYGVSDNAVRKWLRRYERGRAESAPGSGAT
jgi:predicted nucleic acid-binding Zn ribbon protein